MQLESPLPPCRLVYEQGMAAYKTFYSKLLDRSLSPYTKKKLFTRFKYPCKETILSCEPTDQADRQFTYQVHRQFTYQLQVSEHPAPTIKKKLKRSLPASATTTLKLWIQAHRDHPYPTPDEKHELAKNLGLTMCQLNNWFCNERRRIKQRKADLEASTTEGHFFFQKVIASHCDE